MTVLSKAAGKSLEIRRGTDIEDCERLIGAITAQGGDAPLLLANEWSLDSRPGGVAAGAQTLITWARAQSEAVLITHAQQPNEKTILDNLCRRFHGIVAAMMAARIVERDARTDVTKAVHARIRTAVEGMDKLDFDGWTRNRALPLFCIDHSSMAYLRPLYTQTEAPSVRRPVEFVNLVRELMARSSPSGGTDLAALAKDLGIALHELFSNTHIHARTDANHRVYKRSVRGMTFAERTVVGGKIEELGPGAADIERFLLQLEAGRPDRKRLKVFEISVFDSGPGMAARRTGDATIASVAEEAEVVRGCFLRRSSSRSRPGYGMGLPRVLEILKERGGYIGLRTGRLALSRYFNIDANEDVCFSDDDAFLLDADTGGEKATTKERVEGTAVTILVPVGATRAR